MSGWRGLAGQYQISMHISSIRWITYLAVLGQDAWGNFVNLADQLEHGVIWHLAESELALRHVAGVSFAEDGVAVAWDNSASI